MATTAAWGQFGDYLGGVLNPVVALGALILLAAGVSVALMASTAPQEF